MNRPVAKTLFLTAVTLTIGLLLGRPNELTRAEDWPTYRQDQRRSGSTRESLPVADLVEKWRWQSSLPPVSAWPDSARWDAYATLDGLRSMRDYDPVFHPVVVGQRVYLPSNADDTLRCVRLDSGEELWRFTCNGPIRIAPTVFQQRVYFGSDDGFVYSLDAESGEPLWQATASVSGQSFINDGRICSFEPVRSGVLIDSERSLGIVAAGMFPWRATYLMAFDLQSGDLQWRKDLGKGWSLEGAMLLASNHIVAPQGRAAPQLFQRSDGDPVGPLEGGGGSFVLMTDDEEILHGPGNKAGWITQSSVGTRERIATFDRATAIVVDQDRAFVLNDSRLSAIERKSNLVQWTIDCDCPHDLILAGHTIFVGGTDVIRAYDADSGDLLWHSPVDGRAMSLVVANGFLLVSTDAGFLYGFAASEPSPAPSDSGAGQAEDRLAGEQPKTADIPETPFPFAFLQPAPQPPHIDDASLLARWVFHSDQIIGVGKDNKRQVVRSFVRPPSEDGSESSDSKDRHAPLSDRFQFAQAGREQALLLDGRTDCAIAASYRMAYHPSQEMTAMAWVRVDRPQALGSIVSMLGSDQDSIRGWVLGFRNDRFGFGLTGQSGSDDLTWVDSEGSTFQPGQWYLLAATFDGQTARLFIDGNVVAESTAQKGPLLYPDRAPYHVAAYRDGKLYQKIHGMLNEVRLYDRAVSPSEISQWYQEKADRFPPPASEVELTAGSKYDGMPENRLQRGPIMQFTAPQTATVRWTTVDAQDTRIELQPHATARTTCHIASSNQPTREHVAILTSVRHHETVKFRLGQTLDGQMDWTGYFECDGHFDFNGPDLPPSTLPQELVEQAQQYFDLTGHQEPRGLAIVIGAHDQARFAEALCRVSQVDLLVIDDNADHVATARRRLLDSGLYGRAIQVQHLPDILDAGIPNRAFDFLVVTPNGSAALWPLEELALKVQPGGGIVLPTDWVTQQLTVSETDGQRLTRTDNAETRLTTLLVPERSGSADWTHMYGTPDNSAYAGETLSGASRQEDLTLVWAGRPGPRYQSDRGNRKPSPLASGGRLYMQGLRRIIAVDAFNGSIHWSLELPEVVRFNVPRDSANWCVDKEFLFVAAKDRCLKINSTTGQIVDQWQVLNPSEGEFDWGYIAREDSLLIGSSVATGAAFTEFWGGEYWYDEKYGEHAKKVCSDMLFAADATTGALSWTFQDGLIVNPTITIAEGRVTMMVCRSKPLMQSGDRRLEGEEFWNNLHLVSLDAQTGLRLWDVPARPMEGKAAVYLAASEGKLVMVTSSDGAFGVYALDAATGENLWRGRFDWEVDHHGKHLSRPAIVDGQIYLRPLTLELETGRVVSEQFPKGHQCGTYSASRYALFLRAGELAVWDRNTGQSSRWDRVRPDCWISTIPAQGMLLSPEGGGGCSCGGWIETSMAFAPRSEQSSSTLTAPPEAKTND